MLSDLNYVEPLENMTVDLSLGLRIIVSHPYIIAKYLTYGKYSSFLLVLLNNIMTTYYKVTKDLSLTDKECTCQNIT